MTTINKNNRQRLIIKELMNKFFSKPRFHNIETDSSNKQYAQK